MEKNKNVAGRRRNTGSPVGIKVSANVGVKIGIGGLRNLPNN